MPDARTLERPGTRKWHRILDRADITFTLSEHSQEEVLAYLRTIPPSAAAGDALPSAAGPSVRADLERCRRRAEHGHRAVLIAPLPGLTFAERRHVAWMVANVFGEPLVQNAAGDRLVAVYARPGTKRVADGARYHQTREGGGPHTDNVNIPDHWDYLVFSCIRPGKLGGESILLNAFAVHAALERIPAALEILWQPFWWEYRGLSDDFYEAPVVTYTADREPRFRYMRRYMESAHARVGRPMTSEQVWALDALDAVLDDSALQFRTSMRQGEILITYDSQVLHSRTSFCDPSPGAPASLEEAAAGDCRFFDRVWIRKRGGR